MNWMINQLNQSVGVHVSERINLVLVKLIDFVLETQLKKQSFFYLPVEIKLTIQTQSFFSSQIIKHQCLIFIAGFIS